MGTILPYITNPTRAFLMAQLASPNSPNLKCNVPAPSRISLKILVNTLAGNSNPGVPEYQKVHQACLRSTRGRGRCPTPEFTKMTGWKIHHEWVDVFPIENGDVPMSELVFRRVVWKPNKGKGAI